MDDQQQDNPESQKPPAEPKAVKVDPPPLPAQGGISTEAVSKDDNQLLSDQYQDFFEALEILYIQANASGRIQFAQNWPLAALYIFGEALLHFDTEGLMNEQEVEKREALEEQAEQKRTRLLEIMETLEAKSVHEGALQAEYVESVVKELGRDVALLLYAPRFVDCIFPPPPSAEKPEAPAQEQKQQALEVKEITSPLQLDEEPPKED